MDAIMRRGPAVAAQFLLRQFIAGAVVQLLSASLVAVISLPFGGSSIAVPGEMLRMTLLFGAFWAAMSVMHLWEVRRLSGEITEQNTRVRQRRAFDVPLPYDQAFDLAKEAFQAVTYGPEIRSEDRAQGTIEGRTGMTLKTYSQRVAFEIRPTGASATHVDVISHPALAPRLHDWFGMDLGASLEIVDAMTRYMRRRAA